MSSETPQEKEQRLARCSPAYRAAVTGRKELPATKTKSGAVQFRTRAICERVEGGHTIIRAAIDEGQTIEFKLPAGVGVIFTDLKPKRGPSIGGAK
jgi:hypothetical protein